MNALHRLAALAALLCSTSVGAQTPHAGPHGGPPPAPGAKPEPALPASQAARPGGVRDTPAAYRSAFEGYRHFRADEPPKAWRAANEEVHAAGGHLGIYKQQQKERQQPPGPLQEQKDAAR